MEKKVYNKYEKKVYNKYEKESAVHLNSNV